jgi:acyl carrier protein
MEERLQQVFRKVFNDADLIIDQNTSAKDIDIWDSLTHMELIAAIEEEFSIRFSFDEVMRFHNVGDLMRSILGKITV